MGGIATGSDFLGGCWAEDNVYTRGCVNAEGTSICSIYDKRTFPRFLPIRTEILLSLRSLSSFFDFFSSDDVAASRPLFASLFSLSECRLRLELEPFNNDGKPKLNTDDFRVDPGTVGDEKLVSFVGDIVLGARRWVAEAGPEESVGETEVCGALGGTCIDCDEDRLKKGIEDGVRRLVEGFRRTEAEGLRGAFAGTGGTFVLALEAVSARLVVRRSGVLNVATAGWPDGESAP